MDVIVAVAVVGGGGGGGSMAAAAEEERTGSGLGSAGRLTPTHPTVGARTEPTFVLVVVVHLVVRQVASRRSAEQNPKDRQLFVGRRHGRHFGISTALDQLCHETGYWAQHSNIFHPERETVSADNYIRITSFPTQSPEHETNSRRPSDSRRKANVFQDAPRHHPSWLLDCFCGWLCLSGSTSGTRKRRPTIFGQRKRVADAQKMPVAQRQCDTRTKQIK